MEARPGILNTVDEQVGGWVGVPVRLLASQTPQRSTQISHIPMLEAQS